jgi:ATP-dependent exoDNAse (exonuclease V) alpha subunit
MATKNESPDQKDRVTNGLTGRVSNIESNPNWNGNKAMFGTEKEVMAWRHEQARLMMQKGGEQAALDAFALSAVDTSAFVAAEKQEEKQASHIITVKYVNGAERVYRSAADVGSIQLAYAVTTHKAQGSQADTVIVVVHQAVKKQLSREWLYTAVTRARRRVIVLYTPMGLSTAVARQQIFGANLREKVNRYRAVMEGGNVMVRLRAREVMTELDRGD